MSLYRIWLSHVRLMLTQSTTEQLVQLWIFKEEFGFDFCMCASHDAYNI